MSNESKSSISFTRAFIGLIACLVMSSHAFSQCNDVPSIWLERLEGVEQADAPIKKKIVALSRLRDDYQRCFNKKDSVYARIVHRLGDYYRLDGNFEKGIALTNEAITTNKQENPESQRSFLTHSYYNLALYHNLLGLTDDAQRYYDSCIAIGQTYAGKTFIVLMALEKKAFLHFQSGDYERSINIADQGLVVARLNNMADFDALLLIQKAQAESELDRIEQADVDIRHAIRILEDNNLTEYLPNAYAVFANVLATQNLYREAISYYREAIRQNLEQGNHAQAARDLHDLGFLYDKKLSDSSMAVQCYTDALEVLGKLQDPFMLAATYNNLGLVSWRHHCFKKALEYYQQGLKSLPIKFQDDDVTRNPSAMQLASITNDYIPAALLWNKGDVWLEQYRVSGVETFLQHALSSYRQGDRMVDQMRWKQQAEQSKLYWRQKTKAWYASAIEAAYLLNDPADVFHFMEKSRAVLLNDKLAELGANNQLPPIDAERERNLRVRIQSLTAKVSSSPDDGKSVKELWDAQREMESFIEKLEQRYPTYYAYKYDTAVFTIHDAQRELASGDQAWIEFFTTNDAIYALTLTQDSLRVAKIDFPGHASIARKISGLCSSGSRINSNFREFQKLASEYYEKVFKPLGIETPRVTISQDEYFLPFELLPTDSSDATSFLIRNHAFSYAYSASHVLKSGQLNASPRHSLLAIAPVTYAEYLNMQDLRGADRSLENIHASYKDGVTLVGNTATKKSFLKQLPSFDIVHLYSHATADSLGNESAIYFYDSALNLSELQNLPGLKTQLIVLFACNSGVGKVIKGEGIFSLARGFAAAGIPSTISALWEIDNQATYRLAELFYENLGKGEATDIALQHAKLAMINTHDKMYELPYYWAGAVLIGKTDIYQRPIQTSLAPQGKIAIGILAITAVTLILIRWSRRRKARQEYH